MTDTHFSGGAAPATPPRCFSDAVYAISGRTTDEATGSVLDHVAASYPIDLLLHTGDVVDLPSTGAYAVSRYALTRFGAPVLVTPGNHDLPELLSAAYGQMGGSGCRAVDLGSWRVVVACSARFDEHPGRFGRATLEQLDELLGVQRPVLLGAHHPPISPCGHADCTVIDADEFFAVVDRHPNVVAVASGHLHVAAEAERRGVRYLLGPSTCLQLIHEHPLPDHNHTATPIGARLIELHDDGRLRTHLLWAPEPSGQAGLGALDSQPAVARPH